jgi:hypothetical protein
MPDTELSRRWKISETLLERARHALPKAVAQHEQERGKRPEFTQEFRVRGTLRESNFHLPR